MRKAFLWVMLAGFPLGFAGEIGGVVMPDGIQVGETRLVLNGAGLRKKFFVKVYAGGLYLTQKNAESESILTANEPMAIRMHFIYNGVSVEKLVEAWQTGFENAMGGQTASIQDQIEQFNGLFKHEAKRDDVYQINYLPGKGVEVVFNDVRQGVVVAGGAFKRAVFGIWLGEKFSDGNLRSLKKSLLGTK